MTAWTFSVSSTYYTLMVLVTRETIQGQPSIPPWQATQSSTYESATADKAIDGDVNTCSLAAVGGGVPAGVYGWWQLDLGGVFTVYSVTITSGTADRSYEYALNFTITVDVTSSTDVGDSSLCYYFNNGSYLQPGIQATFTCSPNPLNGRYVTMKRKGGYRQDAIGFCEVNISYSAITTTRSTLSWASSTSPVNSTKFSPPSFSVISSSLSTANIEPSLSSKPSTLSVAGTCDCNSGSSAAEVAAIVLGIVLALSLAVIIGLLIYIVRLKRSSSNNIRIKAELNSDDQENHNYEKLRNKSTATASQANAASAAREIPHPPPVTSLFSKQDGSPYETVTENSC